ncbi:hypothetical protein GCM10022198_16010 [Klugiella xanthotipulae]|uniref:GDSL-like lipase/acylhydrolase family protein n=1 Tax=Klugiella xanthotipulae TaxID=244735 RepID=A0A543HH69_9MICO|nr:SGNH/GDSL hydrolase family protein [Klugiella xanthotipulae]TQM57639.1 GDSL-like lipase/acylhydrolase family protein [Klugiella xanthotipulae]
MKRYLLTIAVALTLLVLAGAPTAYAESPAPAPSGYVAMGDSFASGFGLVPYEKNTFTLLGEGNDCQRSKVSYTVEVARRTGYDLTSVACKGAPTSSFYAVPSDRVAWGEHAQLDALSQETALVSFSVGGIDAGFTQVFTECLTSVKFLLPVNNCSGDAAINARIDDVIAALDGRVVSADIRSYDQILVDIRARAPRAQVVGVGYPAFFPEDGAGRIFTLGQRCEGVKRADQRWIVEKTKELNAALRAAMLRNGYLYADAQEQFAGHELCGTGTEYFNGLVSPGIFHPNRPGQGALAESVMAALGTGANGTGANGLEGSAAAPGRVLTAAPAVASVELAANERPEATFSVRREAGVLTLDATESQDADGDLSSVQWYVEGVATEEVAEGNRVDLDIHSEEPVSVTLVVTDDRGLADFSTTTVPAARVSSSVQGVVADGRVSVTLVSTPDARMADIVDLDSLVWPARAGVSATVAVDESSGEVTVSANAAQLGLSVGASTVCLSGVMTDGRPLSSCVPVSLSAEAVAASERLASALVPAAEEVEPAAEEVEPAAEEVEPRDSVGETGAVVASANDTPGPDSAGGLTDSFWPSVTGGVAVLLLAGGGVWGGLRSRRLSVRSPLHLGQG